MKKQSPLLAMATLFAMAFAACGNSGISDNPGGNGGTSAASSGGNSASGGSGGSGGATGSGGVTGSGGKSSGSGGKSGNGGASGSSSAGNGGAGGGTSCMPSANVTPCGGTLTGTWTVVSACLAVSGSADMQAMFGLSCPTGQVTGSLTVAGTWTAKSNGAFVDGTTTTGTEQIKLGAECKTLSAAPVTCEKIGRVMEGPYYETASCTDAADGGCTCTVTVNHTGSMGFVTADPQTSGNFTSADNAITNTQDDSKYSYCVEGKKLTLSFQGTPAAMGTIVLQSDSITGSGGAAGSGGGGAKGGTSGSGTGGAVGGRGGSGAGGAAAGRTGAGGAAQGGSSGSGGSGGGGSTGREGPCDIYAAANMPCGAAYSMVRALSSKYSGPLFQVRSGSSSTNRGTGGTTKDIGMITDGYADTSAVESFCGGTTCTVSKLYDQSGNGNDLVRGSKGPSGNGAHSGDDDYESTATKQSVTAGGHKVYVLYMAQYEGYRTALNVAAKGVPTGNKDQGIYELADGTHYGTQCCWDFGSVSPDPSKYVTMNTLFFGTGFWGSGAGKGPWFGGDFEGGVWMGGSGGSNVTTSSNPSMGVAFALGILHTPVGKYALRMADISTASDLTTGYDGNIPSGKTWGNAGGVVLGVGGDNSNNSYGTFYEGALTNGAPSNATDLLIMKNIQAVGYKK
jgi:non-reducing end alpha-L-arabinofuranosidase